MQKNNYELAEIKKKFKKYYKENLKHKYEELEPLRKIYLKNFEKRFGWCFLGFVCLIIVFYKMEQFSFDLCFYYIAFTIWVCSKPFSKFKKVTKSLVVEQILSFWGNYEYYKDKLLISKDYIKKSALFSDFNKQKQDDAFSGKYHDVEILVSEQELLSVVDPLIEKDKFSPDNEKKTIFHGVLIALHLNKKYEGNTIVSETVSVFNKWIFFFVLIGMVLFFKIGYLCMGKEKLILIFIGLGLLGLLYIISCVCDIFIEKFKKENDYQVFLEDVVFSKKWEIFADDQVEARYVLTPALMERILRVKKLFHGKRLSFGFWDNNLLIAIHTYDDMFETTSLFNSALDYGKVEEVICQLYSIFSVIDVLKIQSESK
jgi:hypothetical protein